MESKTIHSPPRSAPFVSPNGTRIVVKGSEFICRALSHTMAKRIAKALNEHQPNEKGV